MNKTIYTIAILGICLCMAGCAENDLPGVGEDKGIVVSTTVEGSLNADATSRAAVGSDEALTNLVMLVSHSTSASATTMTGGTPFSGSRASGASSSITFTSGTNPRYDKTANKYAYLVGCYPTPTTTPGSVYWTINGYTDLLVSDMWNAGTYTAPRTGAGSGETPLVFKHRLAQLEVYCTYDATVNDKASIDASWGKIKLVELLDAASTATYSYNTNTITFSGSTTQELRGAGTYHSAFISTLLTPATAGTPMASGMYAPTTGTFKLRITADGPTINTADDIVKEITVQLTKLDSNVNFAAGKRHRINLLFTAPNAEISVAGIQITDWVPQTVTPSNTYPYVLQGKYIVHRDAVSTAAGISFHPDWTGATPAHNEETLLNAVAAQFEVAAEDCNGTNTSGVTVGAGDTYWWSNTVDACTNYTQGGVSGWRLPTVKELQAINSLKANFTGWLDSEYWSSTEVFGTSSDVWVVAWNNGVVSSNDKDALNRVRCVRDISSVPVVDGEYPYVESGKYLIFDYAKGSYGGAPFHSIWITTPEHFELSNPLNSVSPKLEVAAANAFQASSYLMNWYIASGTYHATHNPNSIKACGGDGWRLPTEKEMKAIRKKQAKLNVTINSSNYYWTATQRGQMAYRVGDNESESNLDNSCRVRCVRDVPPVIGDYYYTDGSYSTTLQSGKTVAGLVWWVNANNKNNFKIVETHEMNATWGSTSGGGAATSMDDGWANLVAAKTSGSNWKPNYTAISSCDGLTIGGSGWFLPALNEFLALYNAHKSYGVTAFNTRLTTVGGNEFREAKWYWSSSESGGLGYRGALGDGVSSKQTKNNNYLLRCIKEIP